MPAKPYLNLFVGDFLRDTALLSNEVTGVWITMLCQMSIAPERGVLVLDMGAISRLFKQNESKCKQLVDELQHYNVCDIEHLADGKIKFSNRRMVRETRTSAARSEAGQKSVAKRKQIKNNSYDFVITNSPTNQQQNTGNGIGNNNGITNKHEGGTGGEVKQRMYTLNSIVDIETGARLYMQLVCAEQRAVLCGARPVFFKDKIEQTDLIVRWLEAFNLILVKKGDTEPRRLAEYANYFFNWIGTQAQNGNLNKEPEKIFEYDRHLRSGDWKVHQGANISKGSASTAILRKPEQHTTS